MLFDLYTMEQCIPIRVKWSIAGVSLSSSKISDRMHFQVQIRPGQTAPSVEVWGIVRGCPWFVLIFKQDIDKRLHELNRNYRLSESLTLSKAESMMWARQQPVTLASKK